MNHLQTTNAVVRIGFGLANLLLAVCFLTEVAFAGEQYVDRDGHPVGGIDVVSYYTQEPPLMTGIAPMRWPMITRRA